MLVAFRKAHPDCAACIESKPDDPIRGAVVWYSNDGYFYQNQGGCIANAENDASPASCGATQQAVVDCEVALCGPTCPVSGQESFNAFDQCVKQAKIGGCGAFLSNEYVACASVQNEGPAVTSCYDIPDARARFLSLVTRFCGPPVDAGTDAWTDAGVDASDAADG